MLVNVCDCRNPASFFKNIIVPPNDTMQTSNRISRCCYVADINLSIQYLLNCGATLAGSCSGGTSSGAYEFIKKTGFVPFDTCMPYVACSHSSLFSLTSSMCRHADTTCTELNICRTCGPGGCVPIDDFPNATVAEYGTYGLMEWRKVYKIKAEIYARGPVAAGVDALPLRGYGGGVVRDRKLVDKWVNHVVSIVGWGREDGVEYWIVRNSWVSRSDFFVSVLLPFIYECTVFS